MTLKSMHARVSLLACAALLSGSAAAQEFPSKPIRYIVPYSPGATLDIVARTVAPEIAKALGQPVVVENKPGADAIIGFEYVAKQVPADGHTIAIAAVSGLATLPLTNKDLRFDPLKDLPPVTNLVEGRYIFGTASRFSWKNFQELITHAKGNPGKLNYGASSTTVRLSTEALLRALGVNVVYVRYKEGGAYIQAVGSGEVQMGLVAEGSAISLGERFRALAVTGAKRTAGFPEAPTFAELGYPQIRGVVYSLNVPVGIPKAAHDKLHAAAVQALQQPGVRAQYAKIRLDVVADSPGVAAKRLADEARAFAEVAKAAGIRPE